MLIFGVALLSVVGLSRNAQTSEGLVTFSLAFGNIVIGVALCFVLLRLLGILAVVDLAFLPLVLLGWPFAMLMVLLLKPDMSYTTISGDIPAAMGSIRIQVCVLLFLVGYAAVRLGVSFISSRNRPAPSLTQSGPLAPLSPMLLPPLTLFAIVANGLHLLQILGSIVSPIMYFAHSLRNWFTDLFFAVGLSWPSLSGRWRCAVLGYLGVNGALSLIANARAYALFPTVLFFLGYLLSGAASRRRRVVLITVGVCVFPLILVVGNQTRAVFGTGGFDSYSARVNTVENAVFRGELATSDGVILDAVFRLFNTGGHSIVTRTPDVAPFHHFEAAAFLNETIRQLLPNSVFDSADPSRYRFGGSQILIPYGFYITTTNSVEISMLGSFYLLGGLHFVLAGGFVIGILNSGIVSLIRRFGRTSYGPILLSTVVARSVWANNLDLNAQLRSLLWGVVIVAVWWSAVILIANSLSTRADTAVPKRHAPARVKLRSA